MNLQPTTERTDEKAIEAGEALARIMAIEPVPDVPAAQLTGRQLLQALIAAVAMGEVGASLRREVLDEAHRRLDAEGWLVNGELRADKCDRCGEVCGTSENLVRHLASVHVARETETDRVLRNLSAAGMRVPGLADAILRVEMRMTGALKVTDGWPAAGEGKTLLLLGDAGCGKTWAAGAVLAQSGGVFLRASDLSRPMPDDVRRRTLYHGGVVVVDDLGTEHLGESQYALSVVDELVTARHDAGRATLLTSNLLADCARVTMRCGRCVRDRYGERLWSRARVVEVGGEDLRATRQQGGTSNGMLSDLRNALEDAV